VNSDVADFQPVNNESHVWLRIEMGPTKSDKIVHQVIATSERLPKSFKFSPKSLLEINQI